MSIRRLRRKPIMIARIKLATAFLVALFAVIEAGKRWERGSVPARHGRSAAPMIEEEYGVDVAFADQAYPLSTYHGPISAANAEAPAVDRYRTILAQEFALYPVGLIKRSRLERIVLCRGLSFNGQSRAAVPDFEHDTLYLDVEAGAQSRDYQRAAIHHDFFHMIDYRDDGQLYSDEQWAQLNPALFRYGNGGARMQDDPASGAPSNEPGFLTRYATSAVEEDKAEVFAHMMTEYAVVAKRAATDGVLNKKILAMKALLARFCSDMNETFWEELGLRQSLARPVQ